MTQKKKADEFDPVAHLKDMAARQKDAHDSAHAVIQAGESAPRLTEDELNAPAGGPRP